MLNRKYFPSKNFLIALAIAIAVIVVTIIFNYWKPSVTKYTNDNLVASASSSAMSIDSDNDGLPDWKENLYGTNPHKADTDDDGTNDADEIAQNRDPLKANTAPKGQEPNDKIDPAIIEKNQKAVEEYQKLNDIDRFSQDLASNIIAAQPTGGSMDQNTINSIVSKSINELPQKNFTGITKLSDLILQKTDKTNLKKNVLEYAKAFALETVKLFPLLQTDLNAINSHISSPSTSTKSEMLKITSKYQAIVDNLIKMPVPVVIGYYDVNYHLRIINDLEIIIAVEKDIANSGRDSLSIFSDLATYNSITTDLFSTLNTVDGILQISYIEG